MARIGPKSPLGSKVPNSRLPRRPGAAIPQPDSRSTPARTEAEQRLVAWAQRQSIETRHARALAALAECENPKVKQYQFAQRDRRYIAKIARAKQALAEVMQSRGDARLLLLSDAEAIVADLVKNDPDRLRAEQARRKQRIGAERGAESVRAEGAATAEQVRAALDAWTEAGRDPRGFASAKALSLKLSASHIRRIVRQTRTT